MQLSKKKRTGAVAEKLFASGDYSKLPVIRKNGILNSCYDASLPIQKRCRKSRVPSAGHHFKAGINRVYPLQF